MRKFKILSLLVMIGLLLACNNDTLGQNNTNSQNRTPKTNITKNNYPIIQVFNLKKNITQFTKTTWQFEKGEHLTNEWLIKLDSRAVLNFARHTHNPNNLTAPTPNDHLEFLRFSSYVGCASVNGVIGLNKTQAKFYQTDAGYFGDAPHCGDTTQMEGELATFVGSGNINYEFKDNYLILRNDNNQTLFFKKKQ